MKLDTAEQWVREYEEQYANGLRTKPELITAYLRVAGEFEAAEVIAAVSPSHLPELLSACQHLPKEEEFFVFKVPLAENKIYYAGLRKLNSYAAEQ